MTWDELIKIVRDHLYSRNLKSSQRLSTLSNLDTHMRKYYPNIVKSPKILLDRDREIFKKQLAKDLHKEQLNGAEKSIINNFYDILKSSVAKSISAEKTDMLAKAEADQIDKDVVTVLKPHKLEIIAELIKEMLEEKFKYEAKYELEAKFDWLKHVPDKQTHKDYWEEISNIYSRLVDNKWTFDSRLEEYKDQIRTGNQQIDIWFSEPYNFIVEFDESQHFNQFRLLTLNDYCLNISDDYRKLCKPIKPGKSGFKKLKSDDPLFPEMYDGEKQDNRPRQRAFNDYLKDLAPKVYGFNPTLRIPYTVTHKKINEFNDDDLKAIEKYINENNFLDKIIVPKAE